MAAAATAAKKVTLTSSDGMQFVVDVVLAKQSQIIKYVIEDVGADTDIPVFNVTGKILAKVIKYCKKHVELADEEIETWEDRFVKVDLATLVDLMLAAHYLDIKFLMDLMCWRFADIIKGKTTEEIRETLKIKNDFTPEEEDDLTREEEWSFEERTSERFSMFA